MPDYETGTTLKHKLSGEPYIYMGIVPNREQFVIVSPKDDRAYSVELSAIRYYEEMPTPSVNLVRYETYRLSTGSTFTVELISTYPTHSTTHSNAHLTHSNTGETVAFGWVKTTRGKVHATAFPKSEWYKLETIVPHNAHNAHNAHNGDTT